MITKADAIKIGQAICAAVSREQQNAIDKGCNRSRLAARGAGVYAMDNLWYDVLPIKVRDAFCADMQREKPRGLPPIGHGKDAFYKACGWPD